MHDGLTEQSYNLEDFLHLGMDGKFM